MFTGILEPTHLIVILLVALIFLGPKRLPTTGRALGQGLREFKDSISGEHRGGPELDPAEIAATRPEPAPVSAVPSDAGEPAREPGSLAA